MMKFSYKMTLTKLEKKAKNSVTARSNKILLSI